MTLPTLRETAYAKINLALHVRRRRPDGYHELETIFAFAEDGDVLELVEGGAPGLTITGPFAEGLSAGPDNLVLRAATALGRPDVSLRLDKRLPVAAGIGGGSADAAAVMRLLRPGLDAADAGIEAIAAKLGADVPACLASTTARAEGLGYPARPLASCLAGMPLLLLNPRIACPTGPIFAAWDGVDRGPLAEGDPLTAAAEGRNDLEASAVALFPVIAELIQLLRAQPGVLLARMSGSGATCFALFETADQRDAARAAVARSRPAWWCLATALR